MFRATNVQKRFRDFRIIAILFRPFSFIVFTDSTPLDSFLRPQLHSMQPSTRTAITIHGGRITPRPPPPPPWGSTGIGPTGRCIHSGAAFELVRAFTHLHEPAYEPRGWLRQSSIVRVQSSLPPFLLSFLVFSSISTIFTIPIESSLDETSIPVCTSYLDEHTFSR